MQLYDATNGQGICQEIDRLCDTTDSNYPRKDKTSRVNNSAEEVVTWIIGADGTWQFDDDNNTTLPRGVGDLVEGQAQYSFATKFLDILEVEVMDVNGIYRRIQPLDPSALQGMGWDDYFRSAKGFPRYYDKTADGLRLAPLPTSTAVTLVAGIRITFQRTPNLFTVATDTTADTTAPGFASPFHVILAYMAALPYCTTYKPARVGPYMQKIASMKADLLAFYSNREKDTRKRMTSRPIIFR